MACPVADMACVALLPAPVPARQPASWNPRVTSKPPGSVCGSRLLVSGALDIRFLPLPAVPTLHHDAFGRVRRRGRGNLRGFAASPGSTERLNRAGGAWRATVTRR